MKVPHHIALILDGNGRWAISRNLSRNKGHQKGIERIKEIIDVALKLKVNTLTFYCFSTENWNRPKKEIDFLMTYLKKFVDKHLNDFIKNGVRARSVGLKDRLPAETRNSLIRMEEATSKLSSINVNFAINYGSREELRFAIQKISEDVLSKKINIVDIDDNLILNKLEVNLPVDLLIRTSGEQRLSNFLLYQLDYAELYFTNTYWPDFDEHAFMLALENFNSRNRRFGGLKNEN